MKIPSPYSRKSRTDKLFYKAGAGAFHQMRLYLESMDELLQVQRQRIERDRRKHLKKYPQDWQLIEEFSDGDIARVDGYFTNVLLNSSFMASFALFESVFQKVCFRTAYKYFQEPDFNSGPGIINKYRSYLSSILRNDFAQADLSWQDILRYSELRNAIVHHGSIGTKKDILLLIPFLKKHNFITVKKIRNTSKYRFTITDKKFIYEFLACVSKFIRDILFELPPGRRKKLPHQIAARPKISATGQ
ncbi:hypothetical protein [Pseudochryseolinea flava]|uniref:RiboL-PSP-HEPN domain-containing protein n=1 Tax=Pseudochryseolinea flava TaxID=2059302 RepID=A0A364Y1K7_9BACT|nr:hypothetical protein [Pseudochryseolinea flava]RAV99643.1 hypothetical protein DQQ10_18780 [Pseudochryseolinea flava]